MEITPVNRNVGAVAAVTSLAPSDKQAENREMIQAVKAVNETDLLGPENELMFQRDRYTQRMVIRVVNRQTGDVVSQLPPEYVLRLAEEYRRRQKNG